MLVQAIIHYIDVVISQGYEFLLITGILRYPIHIDSCLPCMWPRYSPIHTSHTGGG